MIATLATIAALGLAVVTLLALLWFFWSRHTTDDEPESTEPDPQSPLDDWNDRNG